MFIKKDLRKVPRILEESMGGNNNEENKRSNKRIKSLSQPPSEKEILTDLKLGRRRQEFKGSIRLLCQPKYICKWNHLESLNLYDCELTDLSGINLLANAPKLRTINLGRNPLKTLPDELAQLSNNTALEELWLDDCDIEGDVPSCLYQLTQLLVLRLSNNRLSNISTGITKLRRLQILALDGNQFQSLPADLEQLSELKILSIRQNQLKELPEGVPGKSMSSLEILYANSNQLTSLPASLIDCQSLQQIVVNGNKLRTLPQGMDRELSLPNLQQLVLSHNHIEKLPDSFLEFFGPVDAESATCKTDTCTVSLQGNPILDKLDQ